MSFDTDDIYQVHAYVSVGFCCSDCGAELGVASINDPTSDAWCNDLASSARSGGWYVPPPDANGDMDVVTCFCPSCAAKRSVAADSRRTVQIHVALLDEAVDVWRPVEATPHGPDNYRIVSRPGDPEAEKWQFTTGEIVRCRRKRFADGSDGLVAIERVTGAG